MTGAQLGVVGSPISHSKSPALHTAAYEVLGLDWNYQAYDVTAGALESFVRDLPQSWRGLSVTMPLKREAWALAQVRDHASTYTGAVNTLAFDDGHGERTFRGYNTDVMGIASALHAAGVAETGHGVIVGGGATAESALVALSQLGVARVSVCLRNVSKAADLRLLAETLGVELAVAALSDFSTLDAADIVISTVPGTADVSLEQLAHHKSSVLLDAAYDVWPSPRARAWRASGAIAVSGLSMLAYQAIEQVRIFVTGSAEGSLPREDAVARAMFRSVGLDERGL